MSLFSLCHRGHHGVHTFTDMSVGACIIEGLGSRSRSTDGQADRQIDNGCSADTQSEGR